MKELGSTSKLRENKPSAAALALELLLQALVREVVSPKNACGFHQTVKSPARTVLFCLPDGIIPQGQHGEGNHIVRGEDSDSLLGFCVD